MATLDELLAEARKPSGLDALLERAKNPNPEPNIVQDVARSIRSGIPFGSRIAAFAKSVEPFGERKPYAENLGDEQAKELELANRAPVGNFVGSAVGGALVPLGPLAKIASLPGSLAAKSVAMGGTGAALGLLGGAGNSRDLTNVPETAREALIGGATGGVLGSLIPSAGAGIGGLLGAISARRAPGAEGMSRGATNFLAKKVNAEGADALRSEAARLGDEAMFADLGPSMLGLAQGTAIASDAGRKAMTEALRARSAGAPIRITETANEALGPAVPPRVADAGIRAARAKRDSVNYPNALYPEDITVEGPPQVDTKRLIDWVNNSLPRAEGDEKTFLEDFGKTLFEPNPDLVARPGEKRFTMPTERALGARDQAIAFGGIRDDRGDLRDLMGVYKGLKKPNGMSVDRMREALAEQGYFDHLYGDRERAVAESTPQDLFDVLDSNRIRESDRGIADTIDAVKEQRARLKERAATEGITPSEIPKTRAENLHKIKTDVDKLLAGQPAFSFGPGRFSREDATASQARKKLNDTLESQVPGYAHANRISEQYAKRGEALDIGRKALGSGPSAPWPQELEASIAPMSRKEQSALKIGARGVIGERLGHQINDLRAGESVLKGENDFNRANAEMIFGKDAVNRLVNHLASERKFKATENAVIDNSPTAPRLQALSEYKAIPMDLLPRTKAGMATRVVSGLLNRVLPDKTKYAGEVGGILTKQGAERDQALNALVSWLAEQESRRQAGAARGQRIARGLLGPYVAGSQLLPQER